MEIKREKDYVHVYVCACGGRGATYRAGQQSEVNGEMGGRLMEGNRDK